MNKTFTNTFKELYIRNGIVKYSFFNNKNVQHTIAIKKIYDGKLRKNILKSCKDDDNLHNLMNDDSPFEFINGDLSYRNFDENCDNSFEKILDFESHRQLKFLLDLKSTDLIIEQDCAKCVNKYNVSYQNKYDNFRKTWDGSQMVQIKIILDKTTPYINTINKNWIYFDDKLHREIIHDKFVIVQYAIIAHEYLIADFRQQIKNDGNDVLTYCDVYHTWL